MFKCTAKVVPGTAILWIKLQGLQVALLLRVDGASDVNRFLDLHARPDTVPATTALRVSLQCHEEALTIGVFNAVNKDRFIARDVFPAFHPDKGLISGIDACLEKMVRIRCCRSKSSEGAFRD